MERPIVTLLTDFGSSDHYVAAMKGVILGICPQANLVDISHDVTPYSIPEAAYTLAQTWRCFPPGTTHLAVVDPGVGSERRAIVAEVAGHRFVAPDNGLLTFVLRSEPNATVREISAERFFRHPVSQTFHGRDIFAPICGHLASGITPKKLGSVIVDTITGCFISPLRKRSGVWVASILKIDRFGNIISNLESKDFAQVATQPFRLQVGPKMVRTFRHTYSEAKKGEIFVLFGSSGYVEISANQSDAAKVLEVTPHTNLILELIKPRGTGTRRKFK